MSKEIEEDDRVPRRKLNKQEAIRRLLHTSIRLVMKMEDPFAIHLLVHSADKMLIDIAKKQNKLLRMDWEDYIKPEYHTSFFKHYRKTYNYLKHADEDFSDDLPIHDIAMMNVMQLFVSITNYRTIFQENTDHFTLFAVFIFNLMPQIILPHDEVGRQSLKAVQALIVANHFLEIDLEKLKAAVSMGYARGKLIEEAKTLSRKPQPAQSPSRGADFKAI